MSTADKTQTDRLTVRLPSHDLERLRELARQRNTDVAALGREAIRTYLDRADSPAEPDTLTTLRDTIREHADRVIARHEQVTRALIAALNQQRGNKP